MIDENTKKILDHIKTIFKEKEPFCSEEEFRYYFLSENRAALSNNNNYSLEYPFKYKKVHGTEINEDNAKNKKKASPKDNAKVDAILWDPEDSNHGLCAFEFKYAHGEIDDKHGKHIKEQTPTINIRYNFLEDIDRLESLFDDNKVKIDVGYAIFLTDIEAYMNNPGSGANYYNIRLTKNRIFESGKKYKCTKQKKKDNQEDKTTEKINRKCYDPLVFRSTYTITWNQIDGTKFYCCIVEVKPKGK